ncbi:unnamed protein product, partial [Laminaria digitata]
GTVGIDIFSAVTLGSAGSVFLAGHTTGNWSGLNAGEPDFAACKLDTDGKEIWRWQGGSDEEDHLLGIFADDDGSVVIAGHTKGAWNTPNAGSGDFAAVKLD